MNTEDPPLRTARRLRGYGAFAVAGALAFFLVWAPFPGSATVTGSVVVALICLFGGVQLWLALHTPPARRVSSRFSDPNRLPLPRRARYFRRQLFVCSVLFLVLSAWIAYDLSRLETGALATAPFRLPVTLLYERLGYWPAVLAAPTLGAAFCMFWIFKLNQLPRTEGDA